jgi:hypothetical protein
MVEAMMRVGAKIEMKPGTAQALFRGSTVARIPNFFVVVLSSAGANEPRLEVALKAASGHHAKLLAAHFVSPGKCAIAFSGSDLSSDEIQNVEILARFGDLLSDDQARRAVGGHLASHLDMTSPQAPRLAQPATRSPWTLFVRVMLLTARRTRSLWAASRLSPAIALLALVALVAWGGSLVALAGEARRTTRLVEMARFVCSHDAIGNRELRHLVSHELQAGSSKKDVLHAILSLCQAKSAPG